ncbi:hypothetical protein TrST_g5784 [Triparma strigata]|uniref:Insulysin n=1 Tax=Triparma strigata TaxID=1606541 RepID=A0A9W7BXQ2_9STRA|nr:hypothetical protein TrST_g5784 [Triparma strigata]
MQILLVLLAVATCEAFATPVRPGFGKITRFSSTSAKSSTTSTDTTTNTNYEIISDDESFKRPLLDARSYRHIKIGSNDLEVLLVSHPETDIESASTHVKCGHFMDPVSRPGLAHFHEHMLFLGTEKYPGEDDYEAYLAENGGMSNAYTDMEDTNYYFSLNTKNPDGLKNALDRLSRFFIDPLFTPGAVERELLAVDSEFYNSVNDDNWRSFQLMKHTSNQKHPFSKFGCGNYKTLTNGGDKNLGEASKNGVGSNPRDALKKFWEEQYHAGNVRLVVVGKNSLDELSEMVTETFSEVRPAPKNFEPYSGTPGEKVFPEGTSLGLIREVRPVKDRRSIKISFDIPSCKTEGSRESKPHRILSHLIGYEGPGSFHDVMVGEGFVRGVSAGIGIDGSDFSLFTISISLTEKGSASTDTVIESFFQWLALIKSTPLELFEEYHEEQQSLANMFFKFSENGDPTSFASSSAEVLFKYPASELLTGPSLLKEFNPALFSTYLSRFDPSNSIVTISDPSLDPELPSDKYNVDKLVTAAGQKWDVEPWYRAPYRQALLSAEAKAKLADPPKMDGRFKLPAKNPFIPDSFSIVKADGTRAEPEELVTKTPPINPNESRAENPPKQRNIHPNVRLFYKNMAKTYPTPKAVSYVHLTSPETYSSPRTMTLMRIFERVLREDLNTYSYDASLAGLNYNVACHPTGFRIVVSGWSEKLDELLETVVGRIKTLIDDMINHDDTPTPLSRSYETQAEGLRIETKNFGLDPPYEIANYNSRYLLEDRVWHVDEYEEVMKDGVGINECGKVAKECFMGKLNVNSLYMGNVDEAGAEKMINIVEKDFKLSQNQLESDEFPQFYSLQMPTKSEAAELFASDESEVAFPMVVQEMAKSTDESNSAIEYNLQAGSEADLGFDGVAILELICHMAYTSAYNQLRTKEQLGYIVSAYLRKTQGGGMGLGVTVQSQEKTPPELQERIEKWLSLFRQELEEMDEDRVKAEGAAVVAQLTEKDMKLSHSVGRAWGEISTLETHPDKALCWDRLERIADAIRKEPDLKKKIVEKWDEWFCGDSRGMVAWIWEGGEEGKQEFEKRKGAAGILSSREEVFETKQKFAKYDNDGLVVN